MNKEDILKQIYYDEAEGFLGSRALYYKALKKNKNITLEQVKTFLKNQSVNQIFSKDKADKSKMKRIVGPIGSYQIDLTFYDKFKKANKGYTAILTCIGINSRRAYAVAIKNKDEETMIKAISKLIEIINNIEKGSIYKFESDLGTEFINKGVQAVMRNNDIIYQPIESKIAMGKVERFNGTLRRKISLYMNSKNTTVWIDILGDLINNYNSTEHSTLKQTPNSVSREQEEKIIRDAVEYNKLLSDTYDKNLKIGDKVRTKIKRDTFTREGSAVWSKKVYVIKGYENNRYDIGLKKLYTEDNLLKVDKVQTAPEVEKIEKEKRIDVVSEATKASRLERRLNQAGVKQSNAVEGKRVRKAKNRLDL